MAGEWRLHAELEFSSVESLDAAVSWIVQAHEDKLRNLNMIEREHELHFCLAIPDYSTGTAIRSAVKLQFGKAVRFVDFAFTRED